MRVKREVREEEYVITKIGPKPTFAAEDEHAATEPDATYENVLRIHWLENLLHETEFFEMTSVYDSYLCYIQGQSYPVAHVVSATIYFLEIGTEVQFTQWHTGEISTGFTDAVRGTYDMKAWPNPANDRVRLQLPEHMTGEIYIHLLDATGRSAYNAHFLAGVQVVVDLSVGALSPGIYLVNAMAASGNKATVRLSVDRAMVRRENGVARLAAPSCSMLLEADLDLKVH